ncbi:MAG: carbohydrate ABC transporter permease [Kiritimatiellae bacterium]|nr:carbohydrate ABC transporter permease [Kiritimatiellia bacterium]
MATMMIPGQVTMIPYFLIIKWLGWYNTLTPLWVMSLTGNAFNIFLLRQFMKGIPRDLEDAARIDGCNSWQVYQHVMLPLIKPTLACIAIFTFMGVWNDFMGPLIYLSDQRLYPLSLGLYAFNVQAGGSFRNDDGRFTSHDPSHRHHLLLRAEVLHPRRDADRNEGLIAKLPRVGSRSRTKFQALEVLGVSGWKYRQRQTLNLATVAARVEGGG